jgi:hypothetical protein
LALGSFHLHVSLLLVGRGVLVVEAVCSSALLALLIIYLNIGVIDV